MTDLATLNDLEPLDRAHHDAETIMSGLLALAVCAGNAQEAQRRLKAQDIDVGASTLREWTGRYPLRYRHAQDQQAPLVEADVIRQARETALEIGRVMQKAIEKTEEQLDSGELRDPSKAVHYLAGARKATIDNMLVLDGRPNKIVTSDRTVEQLIDAIAKKAGIKLPEVVDSTAEETS